jgi:hypothetical protein
LAPLRPGRTLASPPVSSTAAITNRKMDADLEIPSSK